MPWWRQRWLSRMSVINDMSRTNVLNQRLGFGCCYRGCERHCSTVAMVGMHKTNTTRPMKMIIWSHYAIVWQPGGLCVNWAVHRLPRWRAGWPARHRVASLTSPLDPVHMPLQHGLPRLQQHLITCGACSWPPVVWWQVFTIICVFLGWVPPGSIWQSVKSMLTRIVPCLWPPETARGFMPMAAAPQQSLYGWIPLGRPKRM
mmetsp:Transcript_82478/g.163751  ORF Transcript_82478/g.163751 Transcript_82478/m.163751 type:complete len:202 (-) Transcript_82478:125-730(-)